MTALSILRLVPRPAGRIVGGEILLHGEDLVKMSEEEMREVRGRRISMILQDPQTSLNPVFTIGNQLIESLSQNEGRRGVFQRAVDALRSVNVAAPERRLEDFEPYAPESLVVTPLLQRRDAIGDDSIDLRLGCYFLLPRLSLSRQAHFCPDSKSSESLYLKLHVPLGEYLVVPAHQTVLGATLEYIKLPYDVCGEILTKSSVARTFRFVPMSSGISQA